MDKAKRVADDLRKCADILHGLADLLTDEGKISGALAYSVLDGTTYVISAPYVVLATGSQNYRFASMWSSGRGDGIAAAYRLAILDSDTMPHPPPLPTATRSS